MFNNPLQNLAKIPNAMMRTIRNSRFSLTYRLLHRINVRQVQTLKNVPAGKSLPFAYQGTFVVQYSYKLNQEK